MESTAHGLLARVLLGHVEHAAARHEESRPKLVIQRQDALADQVAGDTS